MSAFTCNIGPPAASFDSCSTDAAVRDLSAAEPNWKWTVSTATGQSRLLTYRKQSIELCSISSAEHSVGLEALSRRDLDRIRLFFVVTGGIEFSDRLKRKARQISASQVASVCENKGQRLTIHPFSSWLAYSVPHSALRQHFEDLTGSPYLQAFDLPPTDFGMGGAQALYQILRQAERELGTSAPQETSMLARAYQQLALTKLFMRLPHNLVDAFRHGTLPDAPRQLVKVEAFMREHLSNPITLQQLAHAAGCSPRVLQRMFLRYRGCSPMGVLCNLRLAAAHREIKTGNVTSITDLALRFQFTNPGRFSTLYKGAYGLSPSCSSRFARSDGHKHEKYDL
ncbi:helix-turn-helix transcriptional regulator [Ensifer sp. ENS06]|uniref:helix-turn-helix transcriptional regulator n=1 Tax=Ensifer sp. ENS06 TaxID=2769276 RepID=UPI0017833083|nr:helix-turn-helix transcriptional regulator [Ensifer sp. ENS06]MBD9626966.1 helix-turn-helix transcriptional regulator [Ensifer sp. ENS06]